jgi:hypothetical protein
MTPKTKKILIFTGAILGTAVVSILGYQMYIRLTKKVVSGKHNTIIVDENERDDVEVVGFDEEETIKRDDTSSVIEDKMYDLEYGNA